MPYQLFGMQTEIDQLCDLHRALDSHEWQPIATAPKDGREIWVFCDHDADPYYEGEGRLTIYGAHVEGLACRPGQSFCVAVWGGGWHDSPDDGGGSIPDWWFDAYSEFELPVNPTHWKPLMPPFPTKRNENG